MSDAKFLKVIYVIIGILLTAFYGFGVYFIINKVYGAGLLGIGIALTGTGVTLLLGGLVPDDIKDSVSETITPKSISLSVPSSVKIGERFNGTGNILVGANCLYIDCVNSKIIQLLFSDIASWCKRGAQMVLSYENEEYIIEPSSAMKVKALEQILNTNCSDVRKDD